jgi:DNA-binding SARP family transcriptional activator
MAALVTTPHSGARLPAPIEEPTAIPFVPALLPQVLEPPRVSLLGEFALEVNGAQLELPHSARRVVAFLAVAGHPLARVFVAGSLWPDVTEDRAAGNLRSALWRLRQTGADIMVSSPLMIGLSPSVIVDLHEVIRDARSCLDGRPVHADLDDRLADELLPSWYEEWLVLGRERLRQLRLHALETLCARCSAAGAAGRAIDLGLSAVAVEPLRESAHRALICAHLAEGNAAEALRQYEVFRLLAATELGVAPSAALTELVAPLGRHGEPPGHGELGRHGEPPAYR